jgi:TonB family protein
VAGLLGTLFGGLTYPLILQAASASTTGHTPSTGNRTVTFDFAGLDASGDIQLGKPLKLSLALNGVAQSHIPLVAVCESVHFERQIVTMEPDPLSKGLQATAILEPIPPGKLSVAPKFARIRVTFARALTDKKLERVMTRIVYVTLDPQDTPNGTIELTSLNEDDPGGEDARDNDIPPDAIPIADGSLVEENLLPLPDPGQGQAYWQHISTLLSRSWSRTARRVRHAPTSETVRVRFRMYPNGRAQLIEIEKGSGAREIDEAGIHAVVHAQPFPPFPEDIGSEPVDVHVRMRTGTRRSAREVQPVSHSQTPRSNAPSLVPSP